MRTPNPRIRLLAWAAALALAPGIIHPCPARAGAGTAAQTAALPDRSLRLESLEIQGNHHTPDEVIQRRVALSPGDEVTAPLLEAARQRLLATDYFSRVDVYSRRGAERGAVVVVVDVKEHRNPVIETGFGYHDINGWFLTIIGLRFDNTLGADSRTRVGFRTGFRLSGLDGDWSRPLSSDGRLGVSVSGHIYNLEHRFFGAGPDASPAPWSGSEWKGFQQNIQRNGGEVALNYAPGGPTRFSFGISADYVVPDSTFTDNADGGEDVVDFKYKSLPDVLKPELDKTTITGFFLRAVRDTRNHAAYPTAGSFARATMNINNSLMGGDEIYTRAEGDLRKHVHLRNGWVLSSHASAGVTTNGTRYYDRYYLGGSYSIRGFEEGSLSDTDGDDGFWTVNEELRWPLTGRDHPEGPRLVGLVFIDVGQGWRRGESFSASDVESGAGYGVRLRLPWLGTLGLDVGVPISEGRTGDPFRGHASLGFSF